MGTLIHFPARPDPEQGRTGGGDQPSALTSATRGRISAERDATPPAPIRLPVAAGGPSLLWREAVGHEIRVERTLQTRTLAEVADRAGVSTQYLSEIERGRKDPSSEVLEAVASALSLTLLDLTSRVAGSLGRSADVGPQLMVA